MRALKISQAKHTEGDCTPRDSSAVIDQEVIVRFVSGDAEAFKAIFKATQSDLFYVVRRFFRGAFDQEEALQEVWLKIYRMREHFDVNRFQEFLPWAKQVARNRCIDMLKERGRSTEIPVEEVTAVTEHDQLNMLTDQHTRRAMQEFISHLDEEGQRFFEFCFFQELVHEEIAEKLHMSVRRSKYLKKKLLEQMMRNQSLRRMYNP